MVRYVVRFLELALERVLGCTCFMGVTTCVDRSLSKCDVFLEKHSCTTYLDLKY